MAKIVKTNSQEQALKEINESLKIVTSLNNILKDEKISDCKIRINGSTELGNVNEQIPIPFALIVSQIKDYRKRLIKEITDKSKTYSIFLDDSENEIIGIKTEKIVEKTPEKEENEEPKSEEEVETSKEAIENYNFNRNKFYY